MDHDNRSKFIYAKLFAQQFHLDEFVAGTGILELDDSIDILVTGKIGIADEEIENSDLVGVTG